MTGKCGTRCRMVDTRCGRLGPLVAMSPQPALSERSESKGLRVSPSLNFLLAAALTALACGCNLGTSAPPPDPLQ